jgi:hypothetical protein
MVFGFAIVALLGTPGLLRTQAAAVVGQSPTADAVNGPLVGAIDTHLHVAPDIQRRSLDAVELAMMARARGMRGLVLKNHYSPTAAEAMLVRKAVPGIEVFGGVALNLGVGGINPAAVETMAHMTGGFGKVVWFPSQDSDFRHEERGRVRGSETRVLPLWRLHDDRPDAGDLPYVSVSRNGELLPEVKQVIAIIAAHDLVMETGHSSPEETLMLIDEAKRQGVKHMAVTHAVLQGMTVAEMRKAAEAGAYIEWVYNNILNDPSIDRHELMPIAEYTAMLRAVGPEHSVLASEGGSFRNPLPPDGLTAFAAALMREGFTTAEIDMMMKENPARLLGLNP